MIYTSYFANMRYIKETFADKPFVMYSIANSMPKGLSLSKLPVFTPKWEYVGQFKSGQIPWDLFALYYIQELEVLAPSVLDRFRNLSTDIVFLCWESPDKLCHRHLLREYLNRCGLPCREFPTPKGIMTFDAAETYARLCGGKV